MAVMKAVHGFTKSKSQYVSQLGKWNYTKYSKDTDPRDWKVAGYKVSKARKRGKQVQLFLKGNSVTGKVLRTRGYLTSLDQLQLEGSSPRTPPDFNFSAQSPAPPNTRSLPFTNFWDDIKSFKLPSQNLDAIEFTTTVIDLYNSAAAQRAQSLMSLYLPASANSAVPQDLQHNDQHTRVEHWWRLGDPVLVEDLLDGGIATTAIDQYDNYPSPLYVALSEVSQMRFNDQNEQYDIVYSLLEAGYGQHGSIRVSEHRWMSPVHHAVREGDRILLELLLDFGIHPSPRYWEFGCLADPRLPLDMIKILFDHGIQPMDVATELRISVMGLPPRDAVAATALQVASALGYPEAAQFLVENGGADVNAPGNKTRGATALQFALMGEYFDIARLLIDNGANVNAPPSSFNGTTCLQVVASKGDLAWVKVLVRQHADVNAAPHPESHPGGTALQHAVKNGSLDVARYLVDHDAQVNAAPDPHGGATALQYAAIYGFGAIVEFLIRHDADVHAKPAEKNGRTALEGAAENGRLDIVQLLLDHEVGCREEDGHNGQRACELAEAHGHFAIRDLIRGHLGGEDDVRREFEACKED
ncbi:hypothetical protein QQX98_006951 [Neonectria punicea]|uniref:Clr5 domain-containing protein n=1 Tax=Neonectria punicea TaxID=979145 RepID=A0ABR1GZ74_9HYPO